MAVIRPADPHRFAQCRAMGHEWRHKGTAGPDASAPLKMYGAAGLVSVCADCKTRRTKWITRSGEVITRYEHPDGYSLHGDDRLSTKQWRSSFVTTLFNATQPQKETA